MDIPAYVNSLNDSSLQWKDIKWLRTITKLPIILKGILTAEDAILAVEANVDGILVSNHGARQLDGTHASVILKLMRPPKMFMFLFQIDVLQEITRAVAGKVEVYLDGGIRDGTDVFKALAMGAKMVKVNFFSRYYVKSYSNKLELLLLQMSFIDEILYSIYNAFEGKILLSTDLLI